MHDRLLVPNGLAQRAAEAAADERAADASAARVLAAAAPERGAAVPGATKTQRRAPELPGRGRALGDAERAFMEPRFGADFASVRVHDDARAQALLDAAGADALALGEQVALGRGADRRALLAHQLAHVLPRSESGVLPQFKGQKPAPPAPGVDPKFWQWWKLVVGFEGSLEAWKANPANAADKGGETNWGVTKKLYLAKAQALGLAPTEEGFAALTPDQAMRFGQMMWKASGASRIANTGVAIVVADWYWGGIHLKRLTALLGKRGFKASYEQGSPSKATTDFINTLPADELVQEMSDAKGEQYHAIAKADPKQKPFLGGWLARNETRRAQAEPFAAQAAAPQGLSMWERGQRALRLAARAETASERDAARSALDDAVAAIDRRERAGFAHAEEEVSMRELRRELREARRGVEGG